MSQIELTKLENDEESGQSFADQLADLLRRAELGEWPQLPKVRGWRFDISEGRSVSLSIVDNKLGSVYGPATARDSLGGSIYLIWADEKRSLASLERRTIPEFAERLQEWRAASYDDDRAADILPPQILPNVEMYDPTIIPILDGDTRLLFKILKQGETELRPAGVEFLDAGASASTSTRFMRNSLGLDVSYSSTMIGFSFYADSLYGNGYGKRKMFPDTEVERILTDVRETTAQLKKPGKFKASPDSKGDRIILEMSPAGSFLGGYLSGNLSGSGAYNGQTAFKLDDFRQQKVVIRPDLSLVIDGLRAFETSASRVSGEGIPSGQKAIVENGALMTPFLDLKYAKLTDFAPTPTGGTYFMVAGPHKPFVELVKGVEHGLLVYSLLGMHTQDTSSGRFSVSAPQTLVIEDGEFKGKVKATIAGNFFDKLNDPESDFGWDKYEDTPAMAMNCQVTIEEG